MNNQLSVGTYQFKDKFMLLFEQIFDKTLSFLLFFQQMSVFLYWMVVQWVCDDLTQTVMRTSAPPSMCSGRSTAALLTTLLPLVVSLLVWASQSQAQENRADSVTKNSSSSVGGMQNSAEDTDASHSDTKPVIYVNNPQLLREMQEQSFLHHTFR